MLEIGRKIIVAINCCGSRRDLGLGKIVHRVAQQVTGFAQGKAQRGVGDCAHLVCSVAVYPRCIVRRLFCLIEGLFEGEFRLTFT